VSYMRIAPMVVSTLLVACGGESGSSSVPTLDFTFSEGVRGAETAPEISSSAFMDSMSLVLNTRYTGSLPSASILNAEYASESAGDVMFLLASSDYFQAIDLKVNTESLTLTGNSPYGTEILFSEAALDEIFTISIQSYDPEDSEFSLLITQPNRESAGLGANEYLVKLEGLLVVMCDGTIIGSGPEASQLIVNWTEGYVLTEEQRKINFSEVEDMLFAAETKVDRGDYDEGISVVLDVDPVTGSVSGSVTSTMDFDNAGVDQCVAYNSVEGQVVL